MTRSPRTRTADRWRPETQTSPLTDELDSIFGGLREDMVRRHIEAARARADRDGLLTDAERRALGWPVAQ